MRIAIFGSGGVGGYFGALLARAGHDVSFIARGEHLESIRQQGLRVKTHHFGELCIRTTATSNPTEVGAVDLVIFALKTYHNKLSIPDLKPLLDSDTSVLSLQNGVESYSQLSDVLEGTHILPGAAYIESRISSPGEIIQNGEVVRIAFGEQEGEPTPRCEKICELFTAAQINHELSPNIMKTLWTKFVFIVALAGPTTAARVEMSELLQHEEGHQLVALVVKEAESVGRSQSVALNPDIFEKTMSYMEGYAKDLHASMHTDLERGRPLELEALNGTIVRLGQAAGVAVPVNHCIYSLLKPHVMGSGQQT